MHLIRKRFATTFSSLNESVRALCFVVLPRLNDQGVSDPIDTVNWVLGATSISEQMLDVNAGLSNKVRS